MDPRRDRGRREVLGLAARGVAAAMVGGAVWGSAVREDSRAPLTLRPPGALAEEAFRATCIRCGLCVRACPYETLSLAAPGGEAPTGTPHLTPRRVPCRLCQDVPCTAACPTGALEPALLAGDGETMDVSRTRIGLAVIDRENCIASWGLRCDACHRVCPLIDKAITLETSRRGTSRHALLEPRVHAEHCTGCGLCERACVVEKATIFVLPREVALGRVGDGYIRGWDPDDERRLAPAPETVPGDGGEGVLDYLNDGSLDGGGGRDG